MSLEWKLGEIATRLGQIVGDSDVTVSAVATDSRSVAVGDLFVAIAGETHDGHDFASDAVERGAAAVVVGAGRSDVAPRIEVTDTGRALLELAIMRRAELAAPAIAITGSTGKTTTKDMLAAAIPGSWASPDSYNNEVGVPLTILGTPDDATALVVEMGSRGLGHLEWLMPAVSPAVAVITNLGVVHLETFGDVATLADAKWELVEGLGGKGVAVLPADEPRLLNRAHGGATMTFAVESEADVAARRVVVDEQGCAGFVLVTPAGEQEIQLQMPGIHQPANAAAATAAALAIGGELGTIAAGLEAASGSRWRMDVRTGRYTVVNDAYNANPTSVEAALRTVAGLAGRHVAVLGRMAELGEVETSEHTRLGRLAAELGYAAVIMVGEDPGLIAGAGAIGRPVDTPQEAQRILDQFLRDGDVVLVKASRAVGLEGLAEDLATAAGSVE